RRAPCSAAEPGTARGNPVDDRSKQRFYAIQHGYPFSRGLSNFSGREALRARDWGPAATCPIAPSRRGEPAAASPPATGPAQPPARSAPRGLLGKGPHDDG